MHKKKIDEDIDLVEISRSELDWRLLQIEQLAERLEQAMRRLVYLDIAMLAVMAWALFR